MVQFPLYELMNYEGCYNFLMEILHPQGLHCPLGHPIFEGQKPHKFRKNGLPCHRCRSCGKVFNIFTDTILQGIHYDCIQIVLMLHGFVKSQTTQMLSKELGVSYNSLLDWRHKLQEFAFENRNIFPLTDSEVESDEVFQNAGEKGTLHPHPEDPPRVRANKKRELVLTKMTVRPYKGSLEDKANKSD